MDKHTNAPKVWNPGVADEPYKMLVCAGDYTRARDIKSWLVSVSTDAGSDYKAGEKQLRQFSGNQIVDAILAYERSALESIEAGLAAAKKK